MFVVDALRVHVRSRVAGWLFPGLETGVAALVLRDAELEGRIAKLERRVAAVERDLGFEAFFRGGVR